jgi:uncharacterized protein YidB (DUF937 family)
MGILDDLLGNVLGSVLGPGGAAQQQQEQQSPLLQMALRLLQQNGGIGGIVDKLRQAGYGAQADSWVSTGKNEPISPDALQEVLGREEMGDIASQLGMSDREAAGGLASVLPQLIDQMTPQGEVPRDQNDIVAQALALLQKTRTG